MSSSKLATPSALRVASRYLKQAAFLPGEVTDDGWEPGVNIPVPVGEGDGSQVPPARDTFGNEVDSEEYGTKTL